jgi:hypothetical protein
MCSLDASKPVRSIGYFGESDFLDPANELTPWGSLADPDGDRLSNVAEYAYGLQNFASPLEVDVSMGRLRCQVHSTHK